MRQKNIVRRILVVISIALIGVWEHTNVYAVCFADYYVPNFCSACDINSYNKDYTDAHGHSRQHGVKACATHRNGISSSAKFYKRGFVDYNCLAYALGDNSPCSWLWPWSSSKVSLSTVKQYLRGKGYNYFSSNNSRAAGKVIYIYGHSENDVTHFARDKTLGNNYLDGVATISKWGSWALYTSSSYSPYTSAGYGSLLAVASTSYYTYK